MTDLSILARSNHALSLPTVAEPQKVETELEDAVDLPELFAMLVQQEQIDKPDDAVAVAVAPNNEDTWQLAWLHKLETSDAALVAQQPNAEKEPHSTAVDFAQVVCPTEQQDIARHAKSTLNALHTNREKSDEQLSLGSISNQSDRQVVNSLLVSVIPEELLDIEKSPDLQHNLDFLKDDVSADAVSIDPHMFLAADLPMLTSLIHTNLQETMKKTVLPSKHLLSAKEPSEDTSYMAPPKMASSSLEPSTQHALETVAVDIEKLPRPLLDKSTFKQNLDFAAKEQSQSLLTNVDALANMQNLNPKDLVNMNHPIVNQQIELSMQRVVKASEDLSTSMVGNIKRLHIELQPPQLGSLAVDIRLHEGSVFLAIQTQTPEVTELLKSHMENLKLHLEKSGLELGGFDMQTGQQSGESSKGAYAEPEVANTKNSWGQKQVSVRQPAEVAAARFVTPHRINLVA